MEPDTTLRAINELTLMAQLYLNRGNREKAEEIMDLVRRMERDQDNVVSISQYVRPADGQKEA